MFIPVHVRATVLALALLLTQCSCKSDGGRGARQSKVFENAASILDEVAKSEQNGIPDAVLNRTRCLVLVPANGNDGIVTCYESLNRWTRPDLVTFKGQQNQGSDLFVFLLGENEARAMRRGELAIGTGSSIAAGPLVRAKPVVTDVELNHGILAYERRGGDLQGSVTRGTIAAVRSSNPPAKPSGDERQLARSLVSFFNTINPTGIIIHHTAVLPGSERVPSNENEVDDYHSQKGFEVVCFGNEYHVAYHYLILADGKVQPGRPERCQGGHARGYNAYLGISVTGDFSSKDNRKGEKGLPTPTAEQQRALVELCRRLRARYGFPLHRIMRHSDVSATDCPGDRFPFVRIIQQIGR